MERVYQRGAAKENPKVVHQSSTAKECSKGVQQSGMGKGQDTTHRHITSVELWLDKMRRGCLGPNVVFCANCIQYRVNLEVFESNTENASRNQLTGRTTVLTAHRSGV